MWPWVAGSLVVAVSGCATETPICSVDTFSGAAIDPAHWTLLQPSHTDVTQQAGHLAIALPASSNTLDGVQSVGTYDLTGGSLEIHVVRYLTPSVDVRSAFVITLDAGNQLLLGVHDQSFQFQSRINGVDSTPPQIGFDPKVAYFRLRHDPSADLMLYETRTDRGEWVVQSSEPRRLPITALGVQLEAETFNGGILDPGVVELDDLVHASPSCNNDPHELGPL
jgi:hypothetical protein